jgi:preprotein translocase subunit SecG
MKTKKNTKLKLGRLVLWMFIIWVGICLYLLLFAKKESFSDIFRCYLLAVYFPIVILLMDYFRPLLIEKLNLEQSEKIIFDTMYSYIVFLPLAAITYSLFFQDIKSFYIFTIFFVIFSILIFCISIIVVILKVKKMKKE